VILEFLVLKYRSLLRRVAFYENYDSYPFISGDSFRIRCNLDLTTNEFDELYNLNLGEFNSIFLPVGKFDFFIAWLSRQNQVFSNWNLVIHNGDFDPKESELEYLSTYFARIFSVNWMGPSQIATPLPIGLENRNLRRNGVPRDFENLRKKFRNSDQLYMVLASFKESNNLRERGKLLEKISFSPNVHILRKFVPPYEYKKLLTRSKFVISPPGNGADCHRTWEAIYLGTIPIVLRKAWPFTNLDLPVLVIDAWEDLKIVELDSLTYPFPDPLVLWSMFMVEPFKASGISQ
jgi:hypothetical protein